ncbi:hypothetical protein [Candidatus Phytoplasma sp. AldY-WA1]|uniref:hypothetical protein n=1 Tax=Candidatus Phytoplasma sp. AldY-WA1 TaxID=2852100 RepID=UPI00254EF927|nr:hypothetical protein [Candidatus Phytoplasma sp. AldY-WA1]
MKKTNKKQKELIIKDDGVLSSNSYVFGDDFELNSDIYGMYAILEELCSHFDRLYYDVNLNGIEIITKNSELNKRN